jgi:hypothetical protein
MTVRLNLAPETERVLKEKAARSGQTLEAYLEGIADREARAPGGVAGQPPTDPAEFQRGLDELSEGLPALPTLPADFSRADVYGEHP